MRRRTKRRKPYARPDVKSEKIFERQSLVCGQKPGQATGACRSRPST